MGELRDCTIIIIDGTLIGDALYCIMTDPHGINPSLRGDTNVKLIPERVGTSDLSIEIANSLNIIEDRPLLIIINQRMPQRAEMKSENFNGLDILEFVRLRRSTCRTVIILYSFENISSSCVDNRLRQYLSLPGHFYAKMPFRIRTLLETAVTFWSSESDNYDFRNKFLSEKAQRISRKYLRDFKHDIVDKMLPGLKVDVSAVKSLKYRHFKKSKILELFSDTASKFVGCDMKTVFSNEYRLLQSDLNNIENASRVNTVHRKIDNITETLNIVLNKLSADKDGVWAEDFSYEAERQNNRTHMSKIENILKEIWETDLWKLCDVRYGERVRELKKNVTEYYSLRLDIENTLWRLSVWELDSRRKERIDQIMSQLLDPFMQEIENSDYEGALRIFSVGILEALKIPKNTTLNNLFGENHYD